MVNYLIFIKRKKDKNMEELDKTLIKKILYQIMLCIRKNRYTHSFYLILEDIGVRIVLSKIFNYFNNKRLCSNPTEETIKSKEYFEKHKLDMDRISSFFSDEKSKNVYLRMVKFRGSFENKLIPYYSYRKQYWFNDFFRYKNGETMIDCGAYDGDSIRSFCKAMEDNNIISYKIIAFEPDDDNYNLLNYFFPTIKTIKSGVGNKTVKQQMYMQNNERSSFIDSLDLSNKKKYIVCVRRIDDVDECRDATLIKMDIEGSEYEALLGAEKLIKKNKPKLAICIYHKDEDFIRIPLLIHKWVPEYKLYVMQHSNTICETVLYATL